MAPMGAIDTSCGRIGIAEAGAGALTPILFLHGVGSDKSVWAPQLEHFGKSRRAVAVDYPGYGESDPWRGATRDDFASAILAAMDALEIDRAHICGLSLGGVVAIALHAAAPRRCASLILADSFAVHPEGNAIFERSRQASEELGMRALAEARAGMLLAEGADPALRAAVIETMAGIDRDAYLLGAEAVWLADQCDRARAIDVATLVLVGSEDRITPPPLSEEMAALIPGAELEMIQNGGHLVNIEQPATFNCALEHFIN